MTVVPRQVASASRLQIIFPLCTISSLFPFSIFPLFFYLKKKINDKCLLSFVFSLSECKFLLLKEFNIALFIYYLLGSVILGCLVLLYWLKKVPVLALPVRWKKVPIRFCYILIYWLKKVGVVYVEV